VQLLIGHMVGIMMQFTIDVSSLFRCVDGHCTDSLGKATVTVRLIRSFQYRNIKHIILKDVDLMWTTKEFIDYVRHCKLTVFDVSNSC
jgi:hypothetical protein